MLTTPKDDHSRVVLTLQGHKPGSDYINASFIDVRSSCVLTHIHTVSPRRVTRSLRLTLLLKDQLLIRWAPSGG